MADLQTLRIFTFCINHVTLVNFYCGEINFISLIGYWSIRVLRTVRPVLTSSLARRSTVDVLFRMAYSFDPFNQSATDRSLLNGGNVHFYSLLVILTVHLGPETRTYVHKAIFHCELTRSASYTSKEFLTFWPHDGATEKFFKNFQILKPVPCHLSKQDIYPIAQYQKHHLMAKCYLLNML